MISKEHKTIFIHIPKVAGQSIETMFLQDLNLDWSSRGELLLRKKKITEKGPFRLAHLTASEYVGLNYITKEDYEEYFKFSFVRNPFSRAYSYYKYLGYAEVCTFTYFLKKVLTDRVKKSHFFFAPQTDYLYDSNNNLLVDFVGRFESLNQDMEEVVKRSNLGIDKLPHVNKSKPAAKRGRSKIIKNPLLLLNLKTDNTVFKDYKEAYTKEDIEIIERLYKDDLANFNYEFGK